MSLKDSINKDLKTALISGNRFEADVLRGLKAAILNEEISQKKRDDGLEESAIEQLVAREIKKRQESVEIYKQAGRQELADNEEKEVTILGRYLPEQLSQEDIILLVDEAIIEIGEVTIKDMGRIMSAVKSKAGNSVDGALLANIVKDKLNKL